MDGYDDPPSPRTPSDADGGTHADLEGEEVVMCIVCHEIVDTNAYVGHLNDHLLVWPSMMLMMPAEAEADPDDNYEFLTELADVLGTVPRGFGTQEERARVMNGVTLLREDGTLCTVCQEALTPHTDAVELLCGHLYCRGCIEEWLLLSKKCPVCSQDQQELVYYQPQAVTS